MGKGSENSYARKPRLKQGTVAECSQGRKDGNNRLPNSPSLMKTRPGGHQEQSVTSSVHTARSL